MTNRTGRVASTMIVLALTALRGPAQSTYEPYAFTTIAGKAGSSGSVDGTGSTARFSKPDGIALDTNGNLYVADWGDNTIRKVTAAAVVTTLAGRAGSAGSNDGTNSAARFNQPSAVAVDSAGNLYVTDYGDHTIRKVTPVGTNWVVTTLAGRAGSYGTNDGMGKAAQFCYPEGVVVDSAGNLYVADTYNSTIRKMTAVGTNWMVTTIAGLGGVNASGNPLHPGTTDGTNGTARFCGPCGVALDSVGNLYVVDQGNSTIRKMTAMGTNWVVTTLAGLGGSDANANPLHPGSNDGTNSAARFNSPFGLALDGAGNLYVTDTFNYTVRKVRADGTNWVVTTLAGLALHSGSVDATGNAARLNTPSGIAVDSGGNLYVADWGNSTIRKGYPALMMTSSGPNFGFNSGQFGFDLMGQAGKVVVVEGSTDLTTWLPLWTNTLAGSLNFSDPQSGSHSDRFYRAQTH